VMLYPRSPAPLRAFWEIPAYPSITCGGPRYLHQVRASFNKIVDCFRAVDPKRWGDNRPEKKTYWLFGHTTQESEVHCNLPTASMTLTAKAGLESKLNADPFLWRRAQFIDAKVKGAADRSTVLKFIRLHPHTALRVLDFTEQQKDEFERCINFSKVTKTIKEIRELVQFLNFEIQRPAGWYDPYGVGNMVGRQIQKGEAHLKRKRDFFTERMSYYSDQLEQSQDALHLLHARMPVRLNTSAPFRLASYHHKDPSSKRRKYDDLQPFEEQRRVVYRESTPLSDEEDPSAAYQDQEISPLASQEKELEQIAVFYEVEAPPPPTPLTIAEMYPLTEEMKKLIHEKTATTSERDPIVFYTKHDHVTTEDLHRLDADRWLNGALVQAYIELIAARSTTPGFPPIFSFDCYFYHHVLSNNVRAINRTVGDINLFEKEFIVFPLHVGPSPSVANHWAIAIADVQKQVVSCYDSLRRLSYTKDCSKNILTQVLKILYPKHHGGHALPSTWRVEDPEDVPQQRGTSDCGVFMLRFAEAITRKAAITFTCQDMPHFRELMKWEIISHTILPPTLPGEPTPLVNPYPDPGPAMILTPYGAPEDRSYIIDSQYPITQSLADHARFAVGDSEAKLLVRSTAAASGSAARLAEDEGDNYKLESLFPTTPSLIALAQLAIGDTEDNTLVRSTETSKDAVTKLTKEEEALLAPSDDDDDALQIDIRPEDYDFFMN